MRAVERSRVQKRKEGGRGMDQERQTGREGPRGTGGEVHGRKDSPRLGQWTMRDEGTSQ